MKMIFKFHFLLLLIFVIGLSSCQTGYVISESPLSLIDTRRAFVVALGQVRVVSTNGREVYSHYHDKNFKILSNPTSVEQRYYTKLTILGARRPYDIDVQVREEIKSAGIEGFDDAGLDQNLSNVRGQAIQKVLNQSRAKTVKVDGEDPF